MWCFGTAETHPDGFNALLRLHRATEPLFDASAQSGGDAQRQQQSSETSSTPADRNAPMPNPWGMSCCHW